MENMRVGNFLRRYAHRKMFLESVNLEVGIIARVALNFLPRNSLVVIPCSDRHTFVPAHDNLSELHFLSIFEALQRFFQQRLQGELRNFPSQAVCPANALAQRDLLPQRASGDETCPMECSAREFHRNRNTCARGLATASLPACRFRAR